MFVMSAPVEHGDEVVDVRIHQQNERGAIGDAALFAFAEVAAGPFQARHIRKTHIRRHRVHEAVIGRIGRNLAQIQIDLGGVDDRAVAHAAERLFHCGDHILHRQEHTHVLLAQKQCLSHVRAFLSHSCSGLRQQILIPAGGGVEAAALGVEHLERGVGLIGLDDLAEDFHLVGVAQVGGAGGDQVPVVLDVQTVVGEDGVARRQAEVEGVVVVDDGRR